MNEQPADETRATGINLPNKLTLSRIVMAPVFVAFLSYHNVICYAIAFVVFAVATITDYYDGKIARERGLITNFGMLFDPVADKVLMAAAFIMLMKIPSLHIPGWTLVAILAREFLITGARGLAAQEGAVIAASIHGKVKTVVQIIYIQTFLFLAIVAFLVARWAGSYSETYAWFLASASYIGIVLVAVYTVFTGIQFVRTNWKVLQLDRLA